MNSQEKKTLKQIVLSAIILSIYVYYLQISH